MRLLVVEDHAGLSELLRQALAGAGIAADLVTRTSEADTAMRQMHYGAMVLDRGLPGGDSLPWLRGLREQRITLPCLLLTARDALHDRVDGLEAGADDYLPKPFAMEELLARVRALLRRQDAWVALAPAFEDLQVDPQASQLRTAQGSVSLAPAELQLMLLLVQAQGAVVRRSQLEGQAWGLGEAVTPNALDVALHRLRKKLQLVGSRLQIVNTKQVGYALAVAA